MADESVKAAIESVSEAVREACEHNVFESKDPEKIRAEVERFYQSIGLPYRFEVRGDCIVGYLWIK